MASIEQRRLLDAAETGDIATVKDILASGYLVETPVVFDIDTRNPDGTVTKTTFEGTILHLAAYFNQLEVVEVLYRAGADIMASAERKHQRFGHDGQPTGVPEIREITASGIALAEEAREMTLLLNRLRTRTKALKEAVTHGTAQEVAACLHDGGTPPDLPITWTDRYLNEGIPEQMTFSGTLLHYAVAKGQLDKIRVLIAFGADTGRLLTLVTAREDLLTGKVTPTGAKLTTSTLTLANRTGSKEIVNLIETAAVAAE